MPYKYEKNNNNNAIAYQFRHQTMCIRRAEAEILINTLLSYLEYTVSYVTTFALIDPHIHQI